jgi:hypothetical protein
LGNEAGVSSDDTNSRPAGANTAGADGRMDGRADGAACRKSSLGDSHRERPRVTSITITER